MHNIRATLIVLIFGNPHLLEGAEGGQDRASNPHAVLPLWGRHHLDLDGGGSQHCELLGHALTDAREHGGASGQHNVGEQVPSDVQVALHDGLEGGVVDAACLLAHKAWLEEDLRATEALRAQRDDVAVGQLVIHPQQSYNRIFRHDIGTSILN